MQARFYLPMYGRFASPDPARDQHFELTQSWNIYSYCMNAPLLSTDPTGMWSFKNFCVGIGMGIIDSPKTMWNGLRQAGSAIRHPTSPSGKAFWKARARESAAIAVAGPMAPSLLRGNAVVTNLGSAILRDDSREAGRIVGTEIGTTAIEAGVAYGGAKAIGAIKKAVPVNAAGEPAGTPGVIYRGGGSNPSSLTPRPGEDALSFRDSLSNPIGGPAVLAPGKSYIAVDAAKLPPGSVVPDGMPGSSVTPPGHVSVQAAVDAIVEAIMEKGKFPKG